MRFSTIGKKVLFLRSGIWGSLCMGVILGMPVITTAQTTAMPATHTHGGDAANSAKPKKTTKAADATDRKAAAEGTAAHSVDHSKMEGMDHSQMEGMDHSQMEGMDHSQMEGMDQSQMIGMDHSKMEGMDNSQMEGMDMGQMNMQGGPPPPDARDPDYSDGVGPGPMTGMQGMHGESVLASVLIDRLEQFHSDDANGQAIDAQGWVGSDLSKLWFKLDGERSDGRLGATRSEVLWNRAIAPYWGLQTGVRHDFGEGPGRNWAAIGVQGLAPYWFDVQATAYVGESGRTAVRLEAEYEVLLTQRLILQPDVEMNFYGKDDPARDIGRGLSDLDIGLRLRYEITRKVAPYVGVVWSRKFGKTADFARAANGEVEDTQLVAGVRLWF
jgi:copper resistance protein B